MNDLIKENESLKKRIEELENREGLVWKHHEEQFLKIISDEEIIFGDKKFILDNNLTVKEFGKSKKKELLNKLTNETFKIKREKGEGFLYFCEKLNSLIVIYSNNVYMFVEKNYTEYYPVLVKKGDNFGFGEQRDNLLIEGDNYYALQVLQYTHREKIDVIYIDPPYNTGNNDFKYNDNYISNEDGGRHSKWLSFMEKRLKLAKNLLSETGIIFISIDNHEQANLKKLLDSIWGENNFIENYIWESTFRPDNSSKLFRQNAEHVVCYAKSKKSIKQLIGSKERSTGLPSLTKKSMKENVLEFFGNEVKTTLPNGVYKSGSFNSGYELLNDVEVKDGLIITPFKLKGRVIWSQEYLREQLLNGTEIIIKSEGFVPYSKKTTDTILAPNTLIPADKVGDVLVGRSEVKKIFGEAVFNYPKPTSLVKYLVNFCEKQDIIVLDFFAGSGTTGHAVVELNKEDGGNRKFILVTNNENNICENITYERLARINNPKKYNLNIEELPHGLEYLQLKHVKKIK